MHTCIEISLAESKNPENACRANKIVKLTNYLEIICVYQCLSQKYLRCRADKIVKLTNYREIICVYQCLSQKYLRLADSSQIYVARSPMVSIKRFIMIFGLARELFQNLY
ncbi:MAG: hypothetical protein JGK32_05360 [Microcoleus sp. PH2017_31_RDM_U_A]|uniref:hypothetical protein n=1 Tax=Microcoleus sp. PH2017_31_RDM_U_A TaxID=2798841 RepID=UPI001D2A02F3|nr:hypothetical protein [Microcoleus sp. PH2017_31_RDM_U_A]MCC3564773.1 hypothetical protein [Microcoleus sp. PH2017_31_RDM_U_A]